VNTPEVDVNFASVAFRQHTLESPNATPGVFTGG